MIRAIAVLLVLLLTVTALAQDYNVPFRPRAAAGGGGGNLLSETFTGAGYSDADWTESGTGTIDEDETGSCGSGTGWTTDCLELALTTGQTGKTTNAFAAQTGDVWVRFRAKINWATANSSEYVTIAGLNVAGAGDTTGGITVEITQFGGPVYELSLRTGSLSSGSTELDFLTAPASGETHCYEIYMNDATNAWQWWIDGADQGSGTDSGIAVDPTNLWISPRTPTGTSITIYADDVQVSNVARQTCT